MGMHGCTTAPLAFTDCEVPAANLLGDEGMGYVQAMKTLTRGRVTIAARSCGIMDRLIERCVEYMKLRTQGGRKIAEYQGLQWMLADMAVQRDAARLLTQRAIEALTRGERGTLEASTAKLFATEALGRVAVDRIPKGSSEREVGEMLRRAFAIADRSWKAAADGPMAAMFREFYEEVAQRFHRRGMFDLSILKINDRDIAYLYALREGATFYDGTVSFDDEYRDISPGAHLLQEVLRQLPAEGISSVVSHGDHEYKRRWASSFVPQCRLFLFEHSLRGWLGHVARFTLPRLAPMVAPPTAGKAVSGPASGREVSV